MPAQSTSHKLLKAIYILLFLTCPCQVLWSQINIDSVLLSLGHPSPDTNAVLTLYDVGYEIELDQPLSAIQLYKKGIDWSQQINYENGAGKGANYCGIVQFNLGQIDSAIHYAQMSLSWFEKAGNQFGYAASLNNIGNGHNVTNNYTAAIQAYQEANQIYESTGEDMNIISNLNNIGNMLIRSKNPNLALSYLEDALARAKKINFIAGLADVTNNLGTFNRAMGRHNKALEYFTQALHYYEQIDEPNFIIQSLSNIGQCCHTLQDFACAKEKLELALAMSEGKDLPREKINVMTNLGMVYNSQKKYQLAFQLGQEALPLANELGDAVFKTGLLEMMTISSEGLGRHQEATTFLKEQLMLAQEQFDKEKNDQVLDLNRKYESERKERLILEQELALQRQSSRTRITTILFGALILISIWGILWLRSRLTYNKQLAAQQKELQEQRILDIEQKNELTLLNAEINSQEKERNRIARDLHDGLGGTLAAAKLQIVNFPDKDPVINIMQLKQRASKLFDTAAHEVRRISHNMTPAALLEVGLVPAIHDFANDIRETKNIEVTVQAIGKIDLLDQDQEIMLYRIIQELVQNILKHAKASKIIIQFNQLDTSYNLLVEDDGCGFDPEKIKRGLGLKSIKSRVKHLNGDLDIDSVPGQGTTVLIDIPILGQSI